MVGRVPAQDIHIPGTPEEIGAESPNVRPDRAVLRVLKVRIGTAVNIEEYPILPHRFIRAFTGRAGISVGVIREIKVERQSELLEVASTDGVLPLGLCFRQRGQEHASQDGDNRDDHQQFN